jgi:uncharacterized protein (TIGR03083 family)
VVANDLGALYRQGRLAVCDLVDDDVAAVPVPATPGWDVHAVVAHLAGVMEDALAGNLAEAGTDPWTDAQVERARSKSIAELVAQWDLDSQIPEAVLSTPEGERSARAVVDVLTHLCDLQAALGRPLDPPADGLEWASARLLEGFADEVAAQGRAPISVELAPVEILRSRLGRRTDDEVRAYRWSADPEAYLDTWFIFGRAAAPLGEVR